MWKKDEAPETGQTTRPEPKKREAEPAPAGRSRGELATIGRSITIRGDVTGDEDLLIQGRVDGSVNLDQHAVTVGPEGDVKASITARVVTVEGTVKGNLTADDQIILKRSARVQGDIAAPRVVLEDGASFRGGVDMGEPADQGRPSGAGPATQATRPTDTGKPEPGKAAAERTQVTGPTSGQPGKAATDSSAGVGR